MGTPSRNTCTVTPTTIIIVMSIRWVWKRPNLITTGISTWSRHTAIHICQTRIIIIRIESMCFDRFAVLFRFRQIIHFQIPPGEF